MSTDKPASGAASQQGKPLLHISAPFLGLIAFLGALVAFLWIFNGILLPFILASILAYLLDPLVEKMDKLPRISRGVAVLIILGGFLIIFSGLLAVLLPLLFYEGSDFLKELPQMIESLRDKIMPAVQHIQMRLGLSPGFDNLEKMVSENWKEALTMGGVLSNYLTGLGAGIISVFTVPIFTFIIAYFMLKEWPSMSAWMKNMIPKPYQDTTISLADSVNKKISGFIRGQLIVAFILGVAYATALGVAGLKYGILIGLLSGVLGIIPMFGSIIGFIVSVLVAYVQEGTFEYVAIIAAIFLIGQVVEGNFLTPKIVGDSVGLHPLWIFFALLAGGSLMGIIGMLIAVPVAAIVSVLSCFTIEQYKQSTYYQGNDE